MRPTDKVTAGLVAGAIVTIGVYIISEVAKVQVPPEVAAAATMIVSFVMSYFVPEQHPAPREPPAPARGG